MTSRRKTIQNLFLGLSTFGVGGMIWGTAAKSVAATNLVLRPPGADTEGKFIQACIKCGQCVEACPYDTLNLASIKDKQPLGTPFFEPRKIPCYMCVDIPCTKVCPSGALDLNRLADESGKPCINKAQMGLAVIHKETCLAHWGIQCDACYRACPLIGKAIDLKFEKNEITGKHANLIPVVNSDVCTGCGVCERVCVVERAAIFVLPREIATGKVGDHYVKSWEPNDESRIKQDSPKTDNAENTELNYLNDEKELFD